MNFLFAHAALKRIKIKEIEVHAFRVDDAITSVKAFVNQVEWRRTETPGY